MSPLKTPTLVALGLIVAIVAYFLLLPSDGPAKYDELAKCLTSKGISMGGTEWCSSCKGQKQVLGSSFQYIDYHDCDKEKGWCDAKGVTGYPTWVFPNDVTYPGAKSIHGLRTLSGCDV